MIEGSSLSGATGRTVAVPRPGQGRKGRETRLLIAGLVRIYFTGILARYLLREITRTFLLALFMITGIFVLFMVMAEAARQGLTPSDIAHIIPMIVPSSLPYTIPVALLFAITVVYGRVASDNEVVAIKTAGQSAAVVLWPAVFVGISVSLLLNFLARDWIPSANHRVQKFIFGNMEEMFYKVLKKQREFNNPNWPFLIKVRDVVDGKNMIDATFKRRVGTGVMNPDANRYDTVIKAKTATIRFDVDKRTALVHLGKDTLIQNMGNRPSVAFVNNHEFEIPIPDTFSKNIDLPFQELTFDEMAREQARLTFNLERERKIQAATAAMWIGAGRIERIDWSGVRDAYVLYSYWDRRFNGIETERDLRIALAYGGFFFAILGAPVGILFAKRDFLSAFITCFTPIILIYYPLTLAGVNLGKEALVNPIIALWMGNFLLAILAGLFALPPVFKH